MRRRLISEQSRAQLHVSQAYAARCAGTSCLLTSTLTCTLVAAASTAERPASARWSGPCKKAGRAEQLVQP